MKRDEAKLGDLLRDTISGFEGILVARTEWLNGCIRLSLSPKHLHDGKPIDSQTFDIEQLEMVTVAPPVSAKPTGGDRSSPTRAKDPR